MLINEIFHSLQGEGLQMGLPTVFIRFTGCNQDCSWCDTTYAREEGTEMTTAEIINELEGKYGFCKRCCITGGEPLMQMEGAVGLMEDLTAKGYEIVLETNGSISLKPLKALLKVPEITIAMDVKTPSSAAQDSFMNENLEFITEADMLKFIIADENDYEFAKTFLEDHQPRCNIIFTPVDGTDLSWLAERIIADKLQVRLLPQLHKIIWGENARGV